MVHPMSNEKVQDHWRVQLNVNAKNYSLRLKEVGCITVQHLLDAQSYLILAEGSHE